MLNFSKSFIKILQFGYLFLVILGLVGEGVFYNAIGVKILRFSTLSDILVSPIATLTDSPARLVILLVFIGLVMGLVTIAYQFRDKKWSQKLAGIKSAENFTEEDFDIRYNHLFLTYLVITMISFYLGMAISFGDQVSTRIKNNQAQYNTKIYFNSGEAEQVYLLHTNSMYNIYFSKGNKNVKIAPIGTIKNIELTNNPKLK